MTLPILIIIGVIAGMGSGLFGIGGGVIIVPALVYLMGYPQHLAVGTSLAVLLPPVGLAAVLEYHRHGNVNFNAAICIAVALILGAWFGSVVGNKVSGPTLKAAFGIFLILTGAYTTWGALRSTGP